MDSMHNYEDLVGHALKIVNRGVVVWLGEALPAAGVADPEEWCFRVTKTARNERFLADLDTNGLLDVLLAGWDSVFDKLFNNRDPRTLAFDLRRHRNKWAHQTVFTDREA